MKVTSKTVLSLSLLALIGCLTLGCDPKPATNTAGSSGSSTSKQNAAPKFTLAWSEYPSWSIFDVASEAGLIDGNAGAMGPLEKKHNVDIVLKFADYDQCITLYGNSQADAVCITNIDIVGPAASRKSVAILPTSTSNGADACIVSGIDSVDGLQGKTTKGLEKSVSQFCFDRCLEKLGKKPNDFKFANMDPGAAAQSFQGKSSDVEAIMVWNPFVMQTLRTRSDAKVLFDSTAIPEEIIDMVVVGSDSLKKPGGKEFATAVVELYYAMNKRLADPKTADATLTGIGAKFAKLELADMKTVVTQTRFYADPKEAITLFSSDAFQKETMPVVAKFCEKYGLTSKPTTVTFGTGEGMLDFDLSFVKAAAETK